VLSWCAAGFEVVAALVLAAVAMKIVRARGGWRASLTTPKDERSWRQALTHPLSAVMIVTQTLAIVASLWQVYS
jgi:hypothetical protein